MEKDLKYWLAFNQSLKLGPLKFKKLYTFFKDLEKAWEASQNELKQAGLDENTIQEISVLKNTIDPSGELQKLEKYNIQVITVKDPEYPKLLKEIFSAPPLIYIKGDSEVLRDEFKIAIVGTRIPTDYGREVTKKIAFDLALQGMTIVSGMALGIDTQAHLGALEAQGKTIAVLGCGLDTPYPLSNSQLAEKITRNGCLISEYPIGMPPLKQNFPARNRIIAGLSLGTVIAEAGEKSGALITASQSLEQNREVFAIPGSIYNKNSLGPNNLIKMGAKLITSASDILEELNLQSISANQEARKTIPDTKEEALILEVIETEPLHIDVIVQKSGLTASQINSTLTMMEIKGKVKNLGNMTYTIKK